MFVLKSKYLSVREECGRLQDEVVFYRNKYKEAEILREKKEKEVAQLYEQARADAGAKSRLAQLNENLLKENETLRSRAGKTMSYADFKEYLNPEPEDQEIRKAYVAQISGYFNGGLRDYLNYTISLLKAEIARFPLSERETDFLRSAVNVCSLLLEWGDRMTSEHRADAHEEEPDDNVFKAEDTSVDNIREAINR
jgi:hypothetical protein